MTLASRSEAFEEAGIEPLSAPVDDWDRWDDAPQPRAQLRRPPRAGMVCSDHPLLVEERRLMHELASPPSLPDPVNLFTLTAEQCSAIADALHRFERHGRRNSDERRAALQRRLDALDSATLWTPPAGTDCLDALDDETDDVELQTIRDQRGPAPPPDLAIDLVDGLSIAPGAPGGRLVAQR